MATDIFSDLELIRYVVKGLEMESRPELYGEKIGGGELGLNFEVLVNPDSKNKYQLELTVQVNPSDDSFDKHGLRISMTIVGFFRLRQQDADRSGTEDEMKLLLVNGLSVLYGTARPLLATLAQQAGRHTFALPTVDMRKYLDDHFERNAVDLESLTLAELHSFAKAQGIGLKGRRKRENVLAAIAQHFSGEE